MCFLNYDYNFTQIANRLGKDRRTISKEVIKHRFLRKKASSKDISCPLISKPPYVSNSCAKFIHCNKIKLL